MKRFLCKVTSLFAAAAMVATQFSVSAFADADSGSDTANDVIDEISDDNYVSIGGTLYPVNDVAETVVLNVPQSETDRLVAAMEESDERYTPPMRYFRLSTIMRRSISTIL